MKQFIISKPILSFRTNVPRSEGGLGELSIPIVSDLTHTISKDYGVYLEDNGHSLRGLFIIDDKGILRQITMNDLPVGRSVQLFSMDFLVFVNKSCSTEWLKNLWNNPSI